MAVRLNIYESEEEEMAYLRVNDKAPLRVSLDAIFELRRDFTIKVEEIAQHLIRLRRCALARQRVRTRLAPPPQNCF